MTLGPCLSELETGSAVASKNLLTAESWHPHARRLRQSQVLSSKLSGGDRSGSDTMISGDCCGSLCFTGRACCPATLCANCAGPRA